MKRVLEYLAVAGIVASLTAIAACSQVSSAVSTAVADPPQVASALETICNDLVAAEATANTLAKGGAATTIQSAETEYVAPA